MRKRDMQHACTYVLGQGKRFLGFVRFFGDDEKRRRDGQASFDGGGNESSKMNTIKAWKRKAIAIVDAHGVSR